MSLRDGRVPDLLNKYYEKCNYMGISTIRWSEDLVLYSIAYTYLYVYRRLYYARLHS